MKHESDVGSPRFSHITVAIVVSPRLSVMARLKPLVGRLGTRDAISNAPTTSASVSSGPASTDAPYQSKFIGAPFSGPCAPVERSPQPVNPQPCPETCEFLANPGTYGETSTVLGAQYPPYRVNL